MLIDDDEGGLPANPSVWDANDECTKSNMVHDSLGHRTLSFETNGLRSCRGLEQCGGENHSRGREVMEDDSATSSESVASFPGQTLRRTLLLRELPGQVTYQDIVKVLRGGCVLSIFLRQRDRIARVTFTDDLAAREFLQHARKDGVYIKGMRVSFCCKL